MPCMAHIYTLGGRDYSCILIDPLCITDRDAQSRRDSRDAREVRLLQGVLCSTLCSSALPRLLMRRGYCGAVVRVVTPARPHARPPCRPRAEKRGVYNCAAQRAEHSAPRQGAARSFHVAAARGGRDTACLHSVCTARLPPCARPCTPRLPFDAREWA